MHEQVEQFLCYLQNDKGYSNNTIAAYRNDLNQFLVFLGDLEPEAWSQVTQEHAALYVRRLRRLKYADSTVARKVASVKSFFHHLVNTDVLSDDPTATLDSPQVERRSPRPLSTADIDKLLVEPLKSSTPKALRDAALLNLIYSTGMRVSELVSLKLEQIDLEKGTVCCLNSSGQKRQWPINERAMPSLCIYLEKGRGVLLGKGKEPALFLNHRGRSLSRQGLWLIIKGYAKAAAIEQDVTPHTLRHSFAAYRLEHGSSLDKVRELLGHSSLSATKIYAQCQRRPSPQTKTTDD